MDLHRKSSYAAALRPMLRSQIFRPAPLRLLWLPVHYGVISLSTVTIAHGWLPLPLELLLSLLIGSSFAGLTFLGHEALHGAIVRNRFARRLVGRLGFLPFAVPPRLWEAWHNRVHHGSTNRPNVDPDTYPTLAQYRGSKLVRLTTDWVAPGRSRLSGVVSLLLGFSVQSSHMLLVARSRKFLDGWGYGSALLEAAVVWALLGLLALVLGPEAFALAFVLPLLVGNTIIMSFILTNHNLSPQTKTNDPLVNSLSVSGPRFIEWLTLGFGFHVEHHLFPAVSGRYGRELAGAVRRAWPARYQSLPYLQALRLLHRSPRVYETDTRLIDPTNGKVWPTLLPSVVGPELPAPLAPAVSSAGACTSKPSSSMSSTTSALAISFTAFACAGPALRTPEAAVDDQANQASEPQPTPALPAAERPPRRVDAADVLDAHRSPPATTAAVQGPKSPSQASADVELAKRIRAALHADSSLPNASSIEVSSERGHVFLTGTVRSEAERARVESTVQSVSGVVHIDSRLVVTAP